MQKTVRKKVYDTDTAALLGTVTSGLFGDPAGYEERLYQTPEGFYFLYGLGGDASPYPARLRRHGGKMAGRTRSVNA